MGLFGWIPRMYRNNLVFRKDIHLTLLIISTLPCIIVLAMYLATCINQKVAQNQYAVVANSLTMDVYATLDQGTYNNLTLGDYMVYYVATIQYLNFENIPNNANNKKPSIQCYTSDGLQITIDVDIQYQYIRDDIIANIWYKFDNEKNYVDFFSNLIYGSIFTTCANYKSEEYYTQRSTIETNMFENVLEVVRGSNIGLQIGFLQLKDIVFPPIFSETIFHKQMLTQQIQTQLNNRTSQLIAANTTFIQALQKEKIIIINANNQANVVLNQAQINADVIKYQWNQKAAIYSNIKHGLGMDQYEFIDYMRTEVIRLSKAPTIGLN